MMQPSEPPYGMMPPTGQMRGLSLGPHPPQSGYGHPTSNIGGPQNNFPTRSLASSGPPLSGYPGQQGSPAMMAPTNRFPNPTQMSMGPPPGQMTGPPQTLPQMMGGAPPPNSQAPLTGPPPSMMGPSGLIPGQQMISRPPGQSPLLQMTDPPPMSGPTQAMGHRSLPNQMMAGAPPPTNQLMTGAPPLTNQLMAGAPPLTNQLMAGAPPPTNQLMAGAPPPTNQLMTGASPLTNQLMAGPPPATSQMMTGAPPLTNQLMTGAPPTSQMMAGAPPQTGQMMTRALPLTNQLMTGAPPLTNQMMAGAPPPTGQMMAGAPPPRGQFLTGPPGQSAAGMPGMGGYPRQPGVTGGLPTAPVQQGQPRARIDPDQMPNPVAVMKSDQEQRGGLPFLTSSRGTAPPLVTTQFKAQDDGNCSPRYLRATMYTVPCTKDLLNGCKVPLGLVVQPLASTPPDEGMLAVVDHGTGGPLRCNRCKAYMNPYARFIDGGRQYLCPICQCSNEVPPEYFCHLDHQGRRTDTLQRAELRCGSVEYIATKDYCKEGKLPQAPAYIFMIDVSYASIQSGLLSLLSQSILSILNTLPGSSDERGSPIQVGFVTYDKVIHFYNVKASLAQPQMMVLTDIADVFVPMVDGFLVSLTEARATLESFLSQLPDMFASNKMSQVILEPVLRAGMEALKASGRNGRLFVFHSSLPTAPGPGLLKNRLDPKLLGTDKEKTLLSPAGSVYQKLAEECVKFGVGVELFLLPSSYCDVATLGRFASTTGGEVHFYKNYQTSRDGERLMMDLRHSVSRNTGFDAVMRVRACTGLRPTGFYGAFLMNNTTDIELGNIDADKAVAVEIKHDDKLREDDLAFFQAALLYTDVWGQRRLRVHNIAMSCSTKYQDIYRSCEIDTLMSFFSKSIVHASLSMPYKTIRDNFTHQCAIILSCYRKHCSSQSPPGQLILPESLKLLPMYANCLLKSDCLLAPPIVSLDEKCWLMSLALCMPTQLVGAFLYPRVYSLHDLSIDDKGLPPLLRCTGQKLADTGAYLVENGVCTVIWCGQHLPNDFVSKVFGVGSLAQVNPDLYSLPALDNPLSFRVRGVLTHLQATRQHSMKLLISKQRDKSEVHFRRLLKEDKGAGQWEGTSYIDFLCTIHREIKEVLH